MSVNLFGGLRNGGMQTAPKKQTAVDRNLAMGFRELVEAQKPEAAKTTNKGMDTVTISPQAGTVAQKLEELERIHKETDYSGMTDIEIIRTFDERYEKAFPNFRGKLILNGEKYEPVCEQKRKLLKDTVKDYRTMYLNGEDAINQGREVSGYTGLSNGEIIKRVEEDTVDNGTLESKVDVMWKLWGLGAISDEAFGAFQYNITCMQRDKYKETFNTQNIDTQSDHYMNWLKNGAMEGVEMSWSEIKETLFANVNVAGAFGESIANQMNDLFDIFIKGEKEGVGRNV